MTVTPNTFKKKKKVKLRHVWTRVKPEDDKTIAAT